MQPAFTRGFRLHHNGRTIHGAEFPDGEVIVADDPLHGLGTAALSLEELLKSYHGARVEWAPEDEPAPATDQDALRDRIADVVRAFPFDDFGMDDVSYALEADPDTQEWVPKLADAVLAVLPAPADRAAAVQQLADLIEPALRKVRVRLGPYALAMLQRGETVALSGGEYEDLAREAAQAIVHRNDPEPKA